MSDKLSALKKFGQLVANIAGIVSGFGPVFTATVPSSAGIVASIEGDFEKALGVIGQVETIGQTLAPSLPGAQKLIAATPLVAQLILTSTALSGKKIADEALFKSGAQKIADGMADIANSIHADAVDVQKAG